MTPDVNLVPEACRLAARRAGRLRGWVVVLLLAGLGVVLLHLHGQKRHWQLEDLNRRLRQVGLAQQELERELNVAARQRRELIERAREQLELNQGWPVLRELARLYEALPPGAVLSRVSVRREYETPPGGSARRPAPRPRPASKKPRTPEERKALRLRMEIHGYAESFAALSDLIRVFERIEGWQQVRLLRASREELRSSRLVGFSIEVQIDPDAGTTGAGPGRVARAPEGRP